MKNAVLSLIDNTIKNAEHYANFSDRDYKNSQGILMCGNCHTPKQKFLDIDESSSLYEKYKGHPVAVVCKCRKEREEAEKQRQKQIETEMLIEKFRKEGITDRNYLRYTFDFDDNKNPEISRVCKKYTDNFSEMYKQGFGLIFCGQVGTGKTFYAGCIANEIISQARSVLMTNIPSLITKLGFNQEEKNYILNKISCVSLLVIDDLGVERDTPYSLEKIYEIIDTRYRSGKPLIITTNLKYKDMKNCENVGYKRIYDRILQMCHPIAVIGDSRRKEKSEKSMKFMSDFLGLKQDDQG